MNLPSNAEATSSVQPEEEGPQEQAEAPAQQATVVINHRAPHPSTITNKDLARIYESYLDLAIGMLILFVMLYGIMMNMVQYGVIFAYFWLLEVLLLRVKFQRLKEVPANERGKRRQLILGIVEILLAAIFKVS